MPRRTNMRAEGGRPREQGKVSQTKSENAQSSSSTRTRYSKIDSEKNGLKIVSNSKRFPKSIIKDILVAGGDGAGGEEERQELLITTVANERK